MASAQFLKMSGLLETKHKSTVASKHVADKPSAPIADHVAKPKPEAKRRSGRPLAKDKATTLAATKPWEAEGMSRATWFNRQREARLKQ